MCLLLYSSLGTKLLFFCVCVLSSFVIDQTVTYLELFHILFFSTPWNFQSSRTAHCKVLDKSLLRHSRPWKESVWSDMWLVPSLKEGFCVTALREQQGLCITSKAVLFSDDVWKKQSFSFLKFWRSSFSLEEEHQYIFSIYTCSNCGLSIANTFTWTCT